MVVHTTSGSSHVCASPGTSRITARAFNRTVTVRTATANGKADTSPSYEPNDRVLLRVPLDKKTHKLSSQWEGPYRIASPDGVLPNGNYRLADLKDRRRREEVSGDRLRLYLTVTDADRIQPDEFLVDQILKRRGTGRTREYQVKWRGYPINEATWEPRAPLMVRYGHTRQ